MINDIQLGSITSFQRASLGQIIETNLCDFFNWGVVRAGGFVNVENGDFRSISREGRLDNTTWTSDHPFWAHEQDDSLPEEPIRPTGVTVNDIFYETATTTDQYEHSFDYQYGLITFTNPLLTNSRVQASYSYRLAPFVRSVEPWFNKIYLDGWAYEQDSGHDSAEILMEYGLKTPVIVVQYAGERRGKGIQLGSHSTVVEAAILFHVISADPDEQKRLSEIVTAQAGRTLQLYDINARVEADDFEFDYKNSPRPGKSSYIQAVNNYEYGDFYIKSVNSTLQSPRRSLYISSCEMRGEILSFNI